MKAYATLVILLFNLSANAIQTPADAVRAVKVALSVSDEQIARAERGGKASCQYVIPPLQVGPRNQNRFKSRGADASTAASIAQIKCIRAVCRTLPGVVDSEAERLSKSDQLLIEAGREAGLSEEEIQNLVRSNRAGKRGRALSCETSVNMALSAEAICGATAMSCSR